MFFSRVEKWVPFLVIGRYGAHSTVHTYLEGQTIIHKGKHNSSLKSISNYPRKKTFFLSFLRYKKIKKLKKENGILVAIAQ